MIKLVETETYRESLRGIKDKVNKEAIEKKVEKLRSNPYLGKPMKYQHIHLWELRIGKFRVFYLIKKGEIDLLVVLMAVTPKKAVDGKYYEYMARIEKAEIFSG
ncbi:MAG: type II toxin-antitoxin system RelE/ParE family toxin [Nanoarchaeota archaeon]|nr:type II toxin-antitoxin system RelE/ParE family toxin [Nanoarchaeota archaeon]